MAGVEPLQLFFFLRLGVQEHFRTAPRVFPDGEPAKDVTRPRTSHTTWSRLESFGAILEPFVAGAYRLHGSNSLLDGGKKREAQP